MRILFVSNFYPPLSLGGYEQWCEEVALGLRAAGHEVVVLTSRYARRRRRDQPWVHRRLHLEMALSSRANIPRFFFGRARRDAANLTTLDDLVRRFQPDTAVIWGMWNLDRSLLTRLEHSLPGRVVYYIADYWPALPSQLSFYWQAPGRHPVTGLPKRLLAPLALRRLARTARAEIAFEHALFPTAFVRDELERQGVTFGRTKVIYGGVDTAPFAAVADRDADAIGDRVRLLYVGRLATEKGIDVAIAALAKLVYEHGLAGAHLTIAGSGQPEYERSLRRLAERKRVGASVELLGPQQRESLPALYARSDLLVFPSIWQEPFGRVLIEAMAAGLVVVASATGGAAEIVVDGYNAVTFPPGDASALAAQIARLVRSSELRRKLAENGSRTAVEQFDNSRMVHEIDRYLGQVATVHTGSHTSGPVALAICQR